MFSRMSEMLALYSTSFVWALVCVCMRACMRACIRACVCACVCVGGHWFSVGHQYPLSRNVSELIDGDEPNFNNSTVVTVLR